MINPKTWKHICAARFLRRVLEPRLAYCVCTWNMRFLRAAFPLAPRLGGLLIGFSIPIVMPGCYSAFRIMDFCPSHAVQAVSAPSVASGENILAAFSPLVSKTWYSYSSRTMMSTEDLVSSGWRVGQDLLDWPLTSHQSCWLCLEPASGEQVVLGAAECARYEPVASTASEKLTLGCSRFRRCSGSFHPAHRSQAN